MDGHHSTEVRSARQGGGTKEKGATYFLAEWQARIQCGCTTGMLSWSAFWYSTPGAVESPPATAAPLGVAAGVVHTKCVVSISILSLHFAPISCSAIFEFSSRTGSWTFPKHTQIPDVSVMVCVRTRSRFDWNTPAVVRRTSWKVYSVSICSPDSFVEVFVRGEGMAASRCRLR